MDIFQGAPQPELQFSVGDALFDAAFGEYSPSRRNIFTESVKMFLVSYCYVKFNFFYFGSHIERDRLKLFYGLLHLLFE